ncbi:MAG TPA: hypothetical protein VGE65_06695 [Sphingobium sp.]
MKRVLVLTNEAARHPFRQRLPRHVSTDSAIHAAPARKSHGDDQDWKLFLLSFAAFFTVAYSFIL